VAQRLAFEFEYDVVGPVEWRPDCPPPPPPPPSVLQQPSPAAIAAAGRAAAAAAEAEVDAAVAAWLAAVEGGDDDDAADDDCDDGGDDGESAGASLDGASVRTQEVRFSHTAAMHSLLHSATAATLPPRPSALDAPTLPPTPSHRLPTSASLARATAASAIAAASPASTTAAVPLRRAAAPPAAPPARSPLTPGRHATAYRVATLFGKSSVTRMAVSPVAVRDAALLVHAPAAAAGVAQQQRRPDMERRWRARPTGAGDPVARYAATQAVRSKLAARLAVMRRRKAGSVGASSRAAAVVVPAVEATASPHDDDADEMAAAAGRLEWGVAYDPEYAYELASGVYDIGGDDDDGGGLTLDRDWYADADVAESPRWAAAGRRYVAPMVAAVAPPPAPMISTSSHSPAGSLPARRLDFSS